MKIHEKTFPRIPVRDFRDVKRRQDAEHATARAAHETADYKQRNLRNNSAERCSKNLSGFSQSINLDSPMILIDREDLNRLTLNTVCARCRLLVKIDENRHTRVHELVLVSA